MDIEEYEVLDDSPPLYPEGLLSEPEAVRLKYFENRIIKHPILIKVLADLESAIEDASSNPIISIIGSAGVGKTTLLYELQNRLLKKYAPELESNPGRLAYISIELPAPEGGRFDWVETYTRLLKAGNDPFIQKRQDFRFKENLPSQVISIEPFSRQLRIVRQASESLVKHRIPSCLLFDEAHHLAIVANAKRSQDNMENVKSFSSTTKTPIVFFGTYDLRNLFNLSGQLSRRSVDIHFSRYMSDSFEFKSVLVTFQKHLPLAHQPSLLTRSDDFYTRSLGCVGILKDWLTRALRKALKTGQNTLTRELLGQTALTQQKLLAIAREIQEGEEALQDSVGDETEIQNCLINSSMTKPAIPSSPSKKTTKSPATVGLRSPVRDSIGVE